MVWTMILGYPVFGKVVQLFFRKKWDFFGPSSKTYRNRYIGLFRSGQKWTSWPGLGTTFWTNSGHTFEHQSSRIRHWVSEKGCPEWHHFLATFGVPHPGTISDTHPGDRKTWGHLRNHFFLSFAVQNSKIHVWFYR